MQVTICGLHVRYEDDVSHAGHPFAAGLTIDSITAHTTDEDFKPYFATGVPPVVYKLASLSCLSFYLDTVRARSHGAGDESTAAAPAATVVLAVAFGSSARHRPSPVAWGLTV